MKKLILIDGHAMVYRAHFAFINRPLINSKGINTSAITGFTRMLWDLKTNHQATHFAVSFDLKGPTFRHEMYKEYKANRDAQPEDISIALPYINTILKAFNIPVVTAEGYEADDVIGTIAKQAEKEGFEVLMVTPDKDYAQLVSDKIFMFKPARKGNELEILGAKEICEQWGISRVEQVIDVLGLQGDAVDNIPGVPGIGPKTAVKLLAEFDSIEGIIANADKIKGVNGKRMIEHADQARLSKVLATIKLDVPVVFNAKEYKNEAINEQKTTEIFKDLEFRSLAKSILGKKKKIKKVSKSDQPSLFDVIDEDEEFDIMTEDSLKTVEHKYHLVEDKAGRTQLIQLLSKEKEICFDTETTSINANIAKLVGISFSVKKGEAYYVPVPVDTEKVKSILEEFKPILGNEKIAKIGQNIKYDILILKWYGVEIKGFLFDTMIAHYLLEPDMRHNMDFLAETYLKYKTIPISKLIGKGNKQLSMRSVPVHKVVDYACEDADITLQLKEILFKKLEDEKVFDLYKMLEEPLIQVLAQIEFNGINLDADFLNDYAKVINKQILELNETIFEMSGGPFNIASPKQVGELLFNRLKIPYRWRKTKSGAYSTNEEKLTELAKEYIIVENILRHRGLSKLKSTYIDALPLQKNPKTGRIHCNFNQALAATGRLSSSNPNLQNIPIRSEDGARIREAFVPQDENHILMAADYSQIELRLIAEISEDEGMLNAFINGQDIHTATAAKVFEVPYDEVTKIQRYKAKTVNFSIIYGAGATNLSKQLEISRKDAQVLIRSYSQQFPRLREYMDDVVEQAKEDGFVSTILGRKRFLRDINSRNGFTRSFAERMAVNSPVQGSAADMIKVAMINIHKIMKTENYQSKMILQVHDELVFDVFKPELEKLETMVVHEMKNAMKGLKVPIEVGVDTGLNWREAH